MSKNKPALTLEDIRGMDPATILAANQRGELSSEVEDMLPEPSGPPQTQSPPPRRNRSQKRAEAQVSALQQKGSITREDLKTMTPEAINHARAIGALDHLTSTAI